MGPSGTRVAHAVEAGRDGLTVLAYGQRSSDDIAYYPRSGKLFFRGVGFVAQLESVPWA
jgi:uncharacterized cupin superfamily protein